MAPIPSRNTKNSPVKDALHKIQTPKVSVSYAMFAHRETLNMTKAEVMRKACTKLQLTEKLIANAMKYARKCTADDLQILSREIIFKRNLRRHIARMRFCQFMQLKKLKQQQKEQAKQGEMEPQPADSNSNDNISMEDIQPSDEDVHALE